MKAYCHCLIGALTAFVCAPLLASPVVFHVSDPVGPGETALLFGGSLGGKVTAEGWRLSDGPVSVPSRAGAAVPQSGGRSLEVLQASDVCVKVLLPADWQPGMYAVRLKTAVGVTEPVFLNRTELWWWLGGEDDTAFTGEGLRIFGKNLGAKTRAWLVREGRAAPLPVEKPEKYTAAFRVPADLTPGHYQLWAHNGYGGALGFAGPLEVHVARRKPWPTTQFNVRDSGAMGDGVADDTFALQAALAAARKNGGGVVFLPRGTYKLTAGLSVPPRTTLRGEKREWVWLYVPKETPPFGAVIAGNHDFAVEDLSVVSQTARRLVACPDNPLVHGRLQYPSRVRAGSEARNVHLRRLRLQHLRYAHRLGRPDRDPRRLEFNGGTTVALVGRDMEMSDCEVVSPGQPLVLFGGRHSRIIGNHLQTGRNGWYYLGSVEELAFENNTIEARDLEGSYGGVQGKAYRLYIAGNHWGNAYGDEREALTFDTPYYPTWMGRVGKVQGTTLTTRSYAGKEKRWSPGALKGQVCLVCYGKGLGQYIPIVDNTETTLTLAHPWAIVPDATSHLVVRVNKSDVVITNNRFADASAAIQLYAQSYGFIMDGNRSERTGGMYAISWDFATSRGRRYSTAYFDQWLGNDLSQGFIYQQGAFMYGILGPCARGSKLAPPAIPALGNIVRNNRARDDTRIGVFYFGRHPLTAPASSAGYFGRDTVVEGNTIADGPVGLEVYPLWKDTLLRRNKVERCRIPLWDDGIGTWIHPAERLGYQVQAVKALVGGKLDTAAAEKAVTRLAALPAAAPDLAAQCAAVRVQLWRAMAQAQPQGAAPEAFAVLDGLRWEVDPKSPVFRALSAGRGGRTGLRVRVHLAPWAAETLVQAAVEAPTGWPASAAPEPVVVQPGQTKTLTCPVQAPAGADTRWLSLRVTATLDKTPLSVRQGVDVGRRHVCDWLVAGPFANTSGKLPDDAVVPAEVRLDAKGQYDGLGGKVRWKPVRLPHRFLNLARMFKPGRSATALAVCCLRADQDTEASLRLEWGGGGKVWLNDANLLTLPAPRGRRTLRVSLHKGDNLLVWKSSFLTGHWGVAADFTPVGPGEGVRTHAVPVASLARLAAFNPPPPAPVVPGSLAHAAGVAWRLVYRDDFQRRVLGDKWEVVANGQWQLREGILVGGGRSFLAYAAKVAPPVRIEYDARGAGPRDLSCFWFRDPDDLNSGVLIAYAAGDSSRIQVDGIMLASSDAPEARGVPNKWQHVIAQILADGRIQLYADGRLILEARDTAPSRLAAYPGVWTWGGGQFDNVRFYTGAAE